MRLATLPTLILAAGCADPYWADEFPAESDTGLTLDSGSIGSDTDTGSSETLFQWASDYDGDGFHNEHTVTESTLAPLEYSILLSESAGTDCDDYAATTYPGAFELRDGIDQNCDGIKDDGYLVGEINLAPGEEGVVAYVGADANAATGTWFDIGDVNGDGIDDLIISTPGNTYNSATAAGGVHVLLGPISQYDEDGNGQVDIFRHLAALQGSTTDGRLGETFVVTDFDDDGISDIVALAPRGGAEAAGSITLAAGDPALTDYTSGTNYPEDNILNMEFGNMDGSTFDAMTHFLVDPTDANSSAFIFGVPTFSMSALGGGYGMVAGISKTLLPYLDTEEDTPPVFYYYGSPGISSLGRALASGDLDGDGLSELVMSDENNKQVFIAPGWQMLDALYDTEAESIAAHETSELYNIAPGSLSISPYFNNNLKIGDLDGSGENDLVIGTTNAVYGYNFDGDLSSSNLASDYQWRFGANTADNEEIVHVAFAGDLDADDRDELAITTVNAITSEPKVYIFYNPTEGDYELNQADLILISAAGSLAGAHILGGHDLNLDGIEDLIIGAPNHGDLMAGATYILYGKKPE